MKWLPDRAVARLQSLAQTPAEEASSPPTPERRARVSSYGSGGRIGQRFEIMAGIGAGGMGSVVRARDLVKGGEVAIKISSGRGSSLDQRFVREAETLAGLRHPHIVTYVDQGTTDEGDLYIAMEFLRGEPLSATLRRGRLPIADTVTLARGVASALSAAHARGILHRDVKPSNIFLEARSVACVKLLDFGLVRREVEEIELTRTGAFLGTPGYMSPEQARGEREIDARADVFGLGCVLYECLTGVPAFRKDTLTDTLAAVLLEEPPDIASLRPEAPPELAGLLTRMLAKDAANRPANGAAVIHMLTRLVSHVDGPPAGDSEVTTLVRKPPTSSAPSAEPSTPNRTAEPPTIEAPTIARSLVAGRSSTHRIRAAPPSVPASSANLAPAGSAPSSNPPEPSARPDNPLARSGIVPANATPPPHATQTAVVEPGPSRAVRVAVAAGVLMLIAAVALRVSFGRQHVSRAVASTGIADAARARAAAAIPVEPPLAPTASATSAVAPTSAVPAPRAVASPDSIEPAGAPEPPPAVSAAPPAVAAPPPVSAHPAPADISKARVMGPHPGGERPADRPAPRPSSSAHPKGSVPLPDDPG